MIANLIQNNLIEEVYTMGNVAYCLNDNSIFSQTEYKTVRSKEKEGLLQCVSIKHNGKIKLLYISSAYKTLKEMLTTIDDKSFILIFSNFLKTILNIRSNGFLQCSNIDFAIDKIFIDETTWEVYLIYLPIMETALGVAAESFEDDFRRIFIEIIDLKSDIFDYRVKEIRKALTNKVYSLEQLYQALSSDTGSYGMNQVTEHNMATKMILWSNMQGQQILFEISQEEFIIGKNADMVHGVVSFNNAISRVHCKIIRIKDNYYVVDLGSVNGTYINSVLLSPNHPALIQDKDILRLANYELYVSVQ